MRIFLVALALIASVARTNAQACCCTSAGGSYSILPNIDEHVIGLRYTHSNWSSTTYPTMNMNMDGMNMSMMSNGLPTVENMNTLDLFGRFALPKRFYISAFLPVHILHETYTGSNTRVAGLGDASVLLQYAIFDPKKCNGKKSKHQLRLGAGIKAPTGKFSITPDGMFTTDLQLGTGSWDFLFNAVYTYRFKQFGFNATASYKKNLTNAGQFRFGDKIRGGIEAFYLVKLPNAVTFMPKLGTHYEYAFMNINAGEKLTYTGGQNLYADAGFDVYYKNFAFSMSVSPTLYNVYNWIGEPFEHYSIETGIYYSFSKIIKHKKSPQNEKQL